jgi:1-deoxy-D-xylulose-5-phosphate reductoisomerase
VLDVAERLADRIRIVGLATNSNVELLAAQARRFHPQVVSIGDANLLPVLRESLAEMSGIEVLAGEEGWLRTATIEDADQVVVSVAGTPGLLPTLAAIDAGKEIALASKEVLVAAGEIVMPRARAKGVSIVPIDSEHSAIFQCLNGESTAEIEKILLTASGGAFRDMPVEAMATVTAQQALAHPTWRMGKKITIDCATMINKGFEIIEAHWLFGVPADKVDVVIHPQSIIHSMVRYADGSVIAQLGLPDMRLPIQYALLYPERVDTGLPRLDLLDVGSLTFDRPDFNKFPALRLAYEAASTGGTMPAVLNAADEVAVGLFMQDRIGFLDIIRLVERAMEAHESVECPTLDDILEADRWAREMVLSQAEVVNVAGN